MGKMKKIKLIMETKVYAFEDSDGNLTIELPSYPNYVKVEIPANSKQFNPAPVVWLNSLEFRIIRKF